MGTMDLWYAHLAEDELRAGIRTMAGAAKKEKRVAKKTQEGGQASKAPRRLETRAAKQGSQTGKWRTRRAGG